MHWFLFLPMLVLVFFEDVGELDHEWKFPGPRDFFFRSGGGSKDDEGGRNAGIGMSSTTVLIWENRLKMGFRRVRVRSWIDQDGGGGSNRYSDQGGAEEGERERESEGHESVLIEREGNVDGIGKRKNTKKGNREKSPN